MTGSPLNIRPKSQHTSDPALQPFLGPSFDPTAYLNSTLPLLHIASSAAPVIPRDSSTLTDLTSRTQTQLTELSALSARLTATLTQLTDDMLRSGGRLAYDVELLRGEAVALTEVLTDGLAREIAQVAPQGLAVVESESDLPSKAKASSGEHDIARQSQTGQSTSEPQALTKLRNLHHIRSQLQSVISIFDLALSWPLPPSATSAAASNFISVSAPALEPLLTPGSSPASLEAKGQAAQRGIESSVTELLMLHRGPEGVLKAEEKIDLLRDLVGIWRGTSEERYRTRFVENLARMVSDRRKDEEAKGTLEKREINVEQDDNMRDQQDRGNGLLGGLRRLRDEIYLD